MDRTSIRAWRRIRERRIRRNRIKYYAGYDQTVRYEESGMPAVRRDWEEYLKDRWMLRLKDTATICSCWMGSNYLCDRSEGYKRATARILREQSEDKD